MKRGSKVVIILSAVIVALGIVCISIGIAKGGLKNMTVAGMHIADPDDVAVTTESVGNYKHIDAQMVWCSLYIQEGDSFKVESHYIDARPEVEVNGDTLTIKDTAKDNKHIIIGSGGDDEDVTGAESWMPYVIVTVPEGTLDSVNVRGEYGDLKSSGIKVKDMTLETDAGDVDLTASTIGTLKADTAAGDVEGRDISIAENADIDVDLGDVELDGRMLGKTDINCDAGDVKLLLDDKENLYAYVFSTGAGDIEKDGEEFSGPLKKSGGENIIIISTGQGDIEVFFGGAADDD